MVLNIHRNHKAYKGRGRRGGRGGVEVGVRGRLYTCRYTVTTRMIPALRWAAMMSHFNVSVESDGQSHRTVSTNHNLSEEKGEPKRYRTEVLPLTRLAARPNRLTRTLAELPGFLSLPLPPPPPTPPSQSVPFSLAKFLSCS